jgi:hypothetical protein
VGLLSSYMAGLALLAAACPPPLALLAACGRACGCCNPEVSEALATPRPPKRGVVGAKPSCTRRHSAACCSASRTAAATQRRARLARQASRQHAPLVRGRHERRGGRSRAWSPMAAAASRAPRSVRGKDAPSGSATCAAECRRGLRTRVHARQCGSESRARQQTKRARRTRAHGNDVAARRRGAWTRRPQPPHSVRRGAVCPWRPQRRPFFPVWALISVDSGLGRTRRSPS